MTGFTPYLHFMGQTEEAMNFYRSVLGGEFVIVGKYKDVPGSEKLGPEDQEKLMHISLQVNDQLTIMGTDALENMGRDVVPGNNYFIRLQADNASEADRILTALAAGGNIEKPGACVDQFGVYWMVSHPG
jgi:PhnB protein